MTEAPERVGVLVMAYGTPSSPEQVEAFYTDVRRGRPPSQEQLADPVSYTHLTLPTTPYV